MGRHSVPDDDTDVASPASRTAVAALDLDVAPRRGRHASAEDAPAADAPATDAPATDDAPPDEQRTQMIAVVDAELVDADELVDAHDTDELPAGDDLPAAELAAAPDQAGELSARRRRKLRKKAARGESGSQADLRVLRQSPAVRAQCVAALVVAFGLYTLAMVIVGRLDDYVFWLWIPIVVSGVLVGLVLDLAHRRDRAK